MQRRLGHGGDLAPQPLHLGLAVEPGGARDEPLRSHEVPGAALVDVHGQPGPAAQERPGAAGVVEVDVGQQDRAWLEAGAQLAEQALQAGGRAGIDEHAVLLPGADRPLPSEVNQVDEGHPGARIRT